MPEVNVGNIIFTSNPTEGWQGPLLVTSIESGLIFAHRVSDKLKATGIIFHNEVTQVQ